MADAKSLFEDLKRRLDPTSRRKFAGAAQVPDAGLPPHSDSAECEDIALEPPGVATPDSAVACHADSDVPDAHVVSSEVEPISESSEAAPGAPDAAPPQADLQTDEPLPVEPVLIEAIAVVSETSGSPEVFDAMAREIEALAAEIGLKRESVAQAEREQKGGNLLADVRALAAGWFHNGRARDVLNRGPGDLATPEELVAAGAERGVDVSFGQKALHKLEEKDFPCISLDKEGGSHVILGRIDKKTVVSSVGGRPKSIAIKALEKISSGVVFFVKPRPNEESSPDQLNAAPDASEKKALTGMFGKINAEMFATQRKLLWQLALATVLSNLFTIALPMFSMAVYDRVVPHLAWETLWALSIGVMIIMATDFAIRYIRIKLQDSIGLSIACSLQARLYSRIVHGRVQDVPKTSGILNSGFKEVEALCHVLPMLAVSIAVDLPFFIMTAFLIYSIGGMVAVAPFIGAFSLGALHWVSHLGEDAAKKHSRYNGIQSNALLETIGALETVKLTGAERILLRRWERIVDASSYASHINRLQGNFAGQASVVISQVVTVIALIIGVYEISTGAMTVGALSATTLLIGRMMTPISQLMSLLHRAHQLTSAAQTMETILKIPMETAGDSSEIREETPIKGNLSFKNVSFTYPGEQTPCLEGLTLDIRPGEKIGLIGRVGSGKSTLLRLILRIHDASSGTILLDEQDVRQTSPRAIRRHYGFMRQDSILFDDTLQANICYGMEVIKNTDFERAVALSGVKDFASRHPQGYGMRVGSRGERLSGGERQSVSLARVLAENPPGIIMDEPTAAMDNALEAKVVRELRDFAAGKTLLVATHRAPLLALVDRIIWLEGGRIIADGPKDEVMRRLTQPAA